MKTASRLGEDHTIVRSHSREAFIWDMACAILMAGSRRLGATSPAPGRLLSLEELNVGDLEIKRLPHERAWRAQFAGPELLDTQLGWSDLGFMEPG